MPIFSWQRTWHINVWKMVGGTCPHWDFRGSLFVSGTMLKQNQKSGPVSREHANHFLSLVRHTNAEKRYIPSMWETNTLSQYNCTEGSSSPCRQLHVVRFPCERVKSIEMYPYTRSTWSRKLTVVQHTVFDVQASKRLFYTYNTVVLFINYYNYYYCCRRVCPCCC